MPTVRVIVEPPQELADEHTLIAQHYAGFLVGHPYRNDAQSWIITVDRKHRWKEPAQVADECIFCVRLTDDEAVRRVAGYQHQLDIESTRGKGRHYDSWINSGDERIPEPSNGVWSHSAANLRRFVELFQDVPRPERSQPLGWRTRPFPMIDLPLRLKRKLCIEWNHVYLRWMQETGVQYDFSEHQFYRDEEEPEFDPAEGC
jgi:hypothetical protein